MELFKRLFSKVKWPGWRLIILWVLTLPDWQVRIQFWLEASGKVRDQMALIAAVVASRWFSFGLLVLGIGYLAIAGEPKKTIRHPVLPILGLIVFWVAFLMFWSVLVAGYVASLNTSRRIPDAVKAELIEELRKFGSFEMLYIYYQENDNEAFIYARDFQEVLTKAGWSLPKLHIGGWKNHILGFKLSLQIRMLPHLEHLSSMKF